MTMRLVVPLLMLLIVLVTATRAAAAEPVPVDQPPDQPLGLYTSYFSEPDAKLTLEQAMAAHRRGEFAAGASEVLTFGIGPRPVWIHFRVRNPGGEPLSRRLSLETAWLDRIEVYFRHAGQTVAEHRVGDSEAFALRPVDSRYFVFAHDFAPGDTDVFMRVQTADPMVVPIHLQSPAQAQRRAQAQEYSYGFLYGFLFALLAYNVMLYAGLRQKRYLLYSAYLGMFLAMNISYTGHGFKWLWPQATSWAQWSNPVLMVLYGSSGLLFALAFLNTREHFPRTHKAVLGYLGVSAALLLLAVAFGRQREALLVAFTFVFAFTMIMLAMGLMAARSGQKPAQYFLLAAIAAMIGAASTALSTWGFIPFNTWTFRAVDIGILLDATLLALALTYQFRVGREQKLRAEQLATLDPLTGINNRRAFYDKTTPIWNIALRHNHKLALLLLDIDRFKRINDHHGHACGDEVLRVTAKVLTGTIREQDVVARWGGEEFILLLPETDLREAAALAERLRQAVAGILVQHDGEDIRITASFGVVQREPHHQHLDALISRADQCLYQAKASGRNRVSFAHNVPEQSELALSG